MSRWNTPVKVRLAHIDSPELAQAFGPEARDFAQNLCLGRVVDVHPFGHDLYGRAIADVVLANHTCLNEAIVENGYAWFYRQGTPADHVVRKLEADARLHKRGLWSVGHQTAPWEFRNHTHSWFEGFLPFLCPEKLAAPAAITLLGLWSAKKLVALVIMGVALFFPMPDWKRRNLSLVRTELSWLTLLFVVMCAFFCL
ncbi:MAG: thermonuclease family protein [Candidatus Obscuribacterales bacterium]|nr:thermonuclease family protein [Candidatus Obscuribacterales bacterium]